MAESINLTTPDPSTTKYQIQRLEFNRGVYWDAVTSAFVDTPASASIVIRLVGEAGNRTERYEGATADTLIKQLNKLNLSTSSMHKRIMERLIADGRLAGTISGTPD